MTCHPFPPLPFPCICTSCHATRCLLPFWRIRLCAFASVLGKVIISPLCTALRAGPSRCHSRQVWRAECHGGGPCALELGHRSNTECASPFFRRSLCRPPGRSRLLGHCAVCHHPCNICHCCQVSKCTSPHNAWPPTAGPPVMLLAPIIQPKMT